MAAADWFGLLSVAVTAFVDASVFPLSVQALAVGLVLAYPHLAGWLIGVYVLASLLGAPIGYCLGQKGVAHWLQRRTAPDRWHQATEWMQRYGVFGIALGSFSPFPFPALTVAAGALGLPLTRLLLAVAIGRGVKAAVFTLPTLYFGPAVLRELKHANLAVVGAVSVAFLGAFGVWWWKRVRQRQHH